jgi:hypothetical protein
MAVVLTIRQAAAVPAPVPTPTPTPTPGGGHTHHPAPTPLPIPGQRTTAEFFDAHGHKYWNHGRKANLLLDKPATVRDLRDDDRRLLVLPGVRVVLAGRVRCLDVVADAGAQLHFAKGLVLECRTLQLLPGSKWTSDGEFQYIRRDVPLDEADVEGRGGGIIRQGEYHIEGQAKRARRVRAAKAPMKGHTSLTLETGAAMPSDPARERVSELMWQVGDEVYVPGTRQGGTPRRLRYGTPLGDRWIYREATGSQVHVDIFGSEDPAFGVVKTYQQHLPPYNDASWQDVREGAPLAAHHTR